RVSLLAHEALARGGDERDRLREEHAHGVAQRERLLVRTARHLHLRERRRGQLDGGVQRQRRELLALRLLHRLRLLLGELAQAAEQVLGVAAEREAEAAASFHAGRLAERQLVPLLHLAHERLDDAGGRRDRRGERRLELAERQLERARRLADRVEVGERRHLRRRPDRPRERERSLAGGLDPRRLLNDRELGEVYAQPVEIAAARELGGELAHDDDRRRVAHRLAPLDRLRLFVEHEPFARLVLAERDEVEPPAGERRLGREHRRHRPVRGGGGGDPLQV